MKTCANVQEHNETKIADTANLGYATGSLVETLRSPGGRPRGLVTLALAAESVPSLLNGVSGAARRKL